MNTNAISPLIAQFPLVDDLIALNETTWFNPRTTTLAEGLPHVGLTQADVDDAHARLARFAPYLATAFPETAEKSGIIESDVVAIPSMHKRLEKTSGEKIPGTLLLKKDSHLPISGSIKARGGIYEVLTHAEKTGAGSRTAVVNGRLPHFTGTALYGFFQQLQHRRRVHRQSGHVDRDHERTHRL